jgi:hypothetical protein
LGLVLSFPSQVSGAAPAQGRSEDGTTVWKHHQINKKISYLHPLAWADLNKDGKVFFKMQLLHIGQAGTGLQIRIADFDEDGWK